MTPLRWLRTDEYTDAVEALEMTLDMVKRASLGGGSIQQWKWVLIALHNALQDFMVCSLMTSNRLNVLQKNHAKKWRQAFDSGSDPPEKLKLLDFLNLFKRVKDPDFMRGMGRQELKPSEKERLSVEALHEYRNQFMHFLPKSWSIDVSGLPDLALDCTNVVNFLALTSGNTRWTDGTLRQRCESATRELATCLKNLDKTYNP